MIEAAEKDGAGTLTLFRKLARDRQERPARRRFLAGKCSRMALLPYGRSARDGGGETLLPRESPLPLIQGRLVSHIDLPLLPILSLQTSDAKGRCSTGRLLQDFGPTVKA